MHVGFQFGSGCGPKHSRYEAERSVLDPCKHPVDLFGSFDEPTSSFRYVPAGGCI
jgi:hypothetical protein